MTMVAMEIHQKSNWTTLSGRERKVKEYLSRSQGQYFLGLKRQNQTIMQSVMRNSPFPSNFEINSLN